tara:strand:+ start:888 stop:1022 length:135 start_codon:yes stop_codon:yes gene_type:complete
MENLEPYVYSAWGIASAVLLLVIVVYWRKHKRAGQQLQAWQDAE